MTEDHPVALIRDVAARLDRLGIDYLVGGSIAASLHGELRVTQDVDLVVELDPDRANHLVRALEPDFYASREAAQEAVRDRRAFNAVHVESGWKVDFFVRGDAPFDLEEFRRRTRLDLGDGGPPLIVKTPEDSVLRKLEWFRSGGGVSELQWRDVVGLLRHAGTLDAPYLDRWAAELGVVDLLAKARREARPAGR